MIINPFRKTVFWVAGISVWALSITPAVHARDRIDPSNIENVEAVSREVATESEAIRTAAQDKDYQKLRTEEKRARIEALKLELQRRRRKRFTQEVEFLTFYDTNYFNERRGSEKGTTVFHVIPKTTVDLGGNRYKAAVTYTPGVEVPTRFDEHEVTRFYEKFGSAVEIPVGKKTFVRGRYGLFRGVDRANSAETNYSLRTEHNVGSEIEYFLSKKFSGAFEHAWGERHFSDSIADMNDGRDHWFLPRFNYYVTPKTAVFLQAGGGISLGGNGQFDSTNLRLSTGVKGKLTQKSSAFINFGVLRKNLSEEPPFVENVTAPYLELVYLYVPTARTRVILASGSDTENSFLVGNSYFLSQHFTINVTQALVRKFFLLMTAGFRQNSFAAKNNDIEDPKESGRRVDQSINLSYGFRYQIRRNIAITISHLFNYRDSYIDASDFRQHVYVVQLNLST